MWPFRNAIIVQKTLTYILLCHHVGLANICRITKFTHPNWRYWGRGTAVLPQNRSFDSVWSKIGTLQDFIVLCKSAATPLPSLRLLTTNESFQMRYCMNFFFKGHQNYQKSNLKVHEKSCFIKWIWKVLTSGHSDAPWGKIHTLPHLKALISILNYFT